MGMDPNPIPTSKGSDDDFRIPKNDASPKRKPLGLPGWVDPVDGTDVYQCIPALWWMVKDFLLWVGFLFTMLRLNFQQIDGTAPMDGLVLKYLIVCDACKK